VLDRSAHPPHPAPALRLETVGYGHPHAERLIASVQAEYVALYGNPDESPVDPLLFDPPAGLFVVGYADGEPVATGAWRRTDVRVAGPVETAEIKRMYVVPAARRRGYSRVVLDHLEQTAAAAGYGALVLETGTAQPEAIALYVGRGYAPVDNFGHYRWSPSSRCFGKRLDRGDHGEDQGSADAVEGR